MGESKRRKKSDPYYGLDTWSAVLRDDFSTAEISMLSLILLQNIASTAPHKKRVVASDYGLTVPITMTNNKTQEKWECVLTEIFSAHRHAFIFPQDGQKPNISEREADKLMSSIFDQMKEGDDEKFLLLMRDHLSNSVLGSLGIKTRIEKL